RILTERPSDTANAARALYLLADLATDENRDSDAREAYRGVVTRYPGSNIAALSGFHAALIAFIDGNHRTAAGELDDVVRRWPRSAEVNRARYWAGRAHHAAGNADTARARWQAVVRSDPRSYYATRSRERLGGQSWSRPSSGSEVPRMPDVDSAAARIALLEALGMTQEANLETNALAEGATSSLQRAVAVGHALLALQHPSPAIRVGLRAAP